MKEKVYKIEYQSRNKVDEYSITLEDARVRLMTQWYEQMTILGSSDNTEEYWEIPEDHVYKGLKAKIIELNCINEKRKVKLDQDLNNDPMCINESCAWNLKQFCKLPGLCPGRNKNKEKINV